MTILRIVRIACAIAVSLNILSAAARLTPAWANEDETDNPAVLALLGELPQPQHVTLPWRPGRFTKFLAGGADEGHVTASSGSLTGDLYRAPGTAPAPYAVLLSGCGNTLEGANSLWLKLWARYLQDIGVGALALDSLTPRGVHGICGPQSRTWAYRRVDDAHSALEWLARQPFVDARRIFIMGMSNGARVALLSVSTTESWRYHRFAGAVAFYPVCAAMPGHELSAPTMLLYGDADSEASLQECVRYTAARRKTAFAPQLTIYPAASHLFDVYPRNEDYSLFEVSDSRSRVIAFLAGLAGVPQAADHDHNAANAPNQPAALR